MRAYEISASDKQNPISLTERERPTAGPGEVVIDVKACSLNYRDLMVMQGAYGGGSHDSGGVIPLSDGAGVISAVGAGVTSLSVGDRVAAGFMPDWLDGSYKPEYQATALGGVADGMLVEAIKLNAHSVVKIPDHLSFAEAATLPCAGVTAWYSLFVGGSMLPGQTVLLLGTGGVSMFALQFARMAGVRVIVTSSDNAKLAIAKKLGAHEIINYRDTPEWQERAIELTGGVGVDHVVEVGGAGTFNRSLQAVRAGGSIAMIGVLTGRQSDISTGLILSKAVRIQGVYVGSVAMFNAMNRALTVNGLKPVIDRTFAFEQAPDAVNYLKSAQHTGKVVITIDA